MDGLFGRGQVRHGAHGGQAQGWQGAARVEWRDGVLGDVSHGVQGKRGVREAGGSSGCRNRKEFRARS